MQSNDSRQIFIHSSISSFVHNNVELPRENPDHDRLFKIRPVHNEIQWQFQQNYVPLREIAIDETMVKFKEQKFFRQFLQSKPITFDFKLFTLAESKSGYIWDFEVYTGWKGEIEQNHTINVVLRLMRPLEGKGYRVFTDNFYTSPDLYLTLRERLVYACGIERTTRKDLPKDIMDHKLPAVKNLDRGAALFRKKKSFWQLRGTSKSGLAWSFLLLGHVLKIMCLVIFRITLSYATSIFITITQEPEQIIFWK